MVVIKRVDRNLIAALKQSYFFVTIARNVQNMKPVQIFTTAFFIYYLQNKQ